MTCSDPRPRKSYVCHGPRTWALIRAAYLAGESAPSLSQRWGCSVGGLRKRAGAEGWTRRAAALAADAMAPEPGDVGAEIGLAEGAADLEPRAVARRALVEAARLLLRGETARAAEAARTAELMARAADRLGGGEPADLEPDDAAELEAVRAKVAAMIEAARAEGAREAEDGRG